MRFLLGILASLACLAPMIVSAADRDGMVATRIARRLKATDQLRGCDVSVSVSNGAAQLKGTVKNQEQARIAVAAARGVAGVREVIDRLGVVQRRVSPLPPQRRGHSPVKQATYETSQAMPPQSSSAPYDSGSLDRAPYDRAPHRIPMHEMPSGQLMDYQLEHGWSGPPSPCFGPPPGLGPRPANGTPKHRLLHKIQWWPARPACPISRMTHLGSSWGYYPTCWRQWPPCAPSCPPPIPPEAYLPADMEETRVERDGSTPPEMLPTPDDQPPDAPVDPKKGPAKRP